MTLSYETGAISVEISSLLKEYDYKDASKREKTRFDRQMKIVVRFWDFYSQNNLHELAVIKGTLSYVSHGYWKRSGKEAYRLNIDQEIKHESPHRYGGLPDIWVLRFADRQKNKVNFLHISLHKNETLDEEIYLDIQDALILEAAVSKAMQMLSPWLQNSTNGIFDEN